jgi:hypothetical protein
MLILEIAAGIVLGVLALCFLPLILRLAFISAVVCVGGFIVLLVIGGIASMFTPVSHPALEVDPVVPSVGVGCSQTDWGAVAAGQFPAPCLHSGTPTVSEIVVNGHKSATEANSDDDIFATSDAPAGPDLLAK